MNNFEPRNYRIDNVELNWAKLTKPVSPFGQPQYELQIATKDKAIANDWKTNHLTVKDKDGKYSVSLKRKALKADGSENGAPRVVGADAQPIDASSLGNESTGNVIVYQMYYKTAGREGIASSLTAVQVTDFKEYTGSVEFEPIVDIHGASQESDTTQQAEIAF
jgi:hypothetical protein